MVLPISPNNNNQLLSRMSTGIWVSATHVQLNFAFYFLLVLADMAQHHHQL